MRSGAGLLFALAATMAVGPMVTYGLSTVSALIIADLGISKAQFGLLATACFFVAGISSFSFGGLSHRLRLKTQLVIMFGGTALTLFGIAASPTYMWLLAAVALAGAPQAFSNPMTNRVIVERIAADKRASWIGVKQSGVQGSQLFAGLFFPALALLAGWQGAFVAAAIVILILMVWSFGRLKEAGPQSMPDPMPVATTENKVIALRADAVRLPVTVFILTAFAFFSGTGLQATNTYLPLFAHQEVHLSLVVAGLTAGFAGVVGVSSRILWGRQMNTGASTPCMLAIIGGGALLGALCLMASGELHAEPLLWLGVALHGGTALGGNVVVMSGLMREVPASRVAAASGIVGLGMYFGFALGPLMMGMLLEWTDSFRISWAAVASCYICCLALALLPKEWTSSRG